MNRKMKIKVESEKYGSNSPLIRSENDLIKKIQKDYNEYRMGGFWRCDCGQEISYNETIERTNKNVLLKVKCPSCGKMIERFIKPGEQKFDSVEFDILFKKYGYQIRRDCSNFILEDIDDIYGDMSHRFFIAVMTYNGTTKFFTYLKNLISRRFEDFERKNSRACRTSAVQCQCCGRWVGAITRIHLMMNKHAKVKNFIGHKALHNKIIQEYGKEKFNELIDDKKMSKLKSEKWEGNKYSRKQRQVIKSRIVQAYKEMFPNATISIGNISMSDRDPITDIEYSDMIADKSKFSDIDGFYQKIASSDGNNIFVAESVPTEIRDICKFYAKRTASSLCKKPSTMRRLNKTRALSDIGQLEEMLEKVFSLMFFDYSIEEISNIYGYEQTEIKFWLKKIKNNSELKRELNFNL